MYFSFYSEKTFFVQDSCGGLSIGWIYLVNFSVITLNKIIKFNYSRYVTDDRNPTELEHVNFIIIS